MKNLFSLLAIFVLLLAAGGCSGSDVPEQYIPVQEILESIQAAYGDDYLPIMDIPPEFLEAEFGLTEDMYTEAVGQQPLMSTHPDRVVIVHAAPKRADEVEAALLAARDNIANHELQYPMNIPKTNAAKVIRNRSYVAFLLVGAPLEDANATEQQAVDYYEHEVAKATDAFYAFFQ